MPVSGTANPQPTRRDVLRDAGKLAAVSALAGVAVPAVHAGGNSLIQVALIGCGGRGTGAAANAMAAQKSAGEPVKLVAMADVFPDRLKSSYGQLSRRKSDQIDVPEGRQFVGFDGYKQAMDALKPGDIAILATPPAFRWPQFAYAIKKGLHVFMEKPVTVDGPSTRKFLALAEESEKKGLKVGVGLMCRHCAARGEMYKKIKDGAIGDLTMLRAYRQAGPTASAFSYPKQREGLKELDFQIRRFHSFLWASGGAYSDFLIHNIDECCWMKDAWPVKAQSSGGRHYRGDAIDQNFDTYSTEFTFADGTKLFLEGRTMQGAHQEFASYAHGTKGSAVISESGHAPSRCRLFKGQNVTNDKDIIWKCMEREPDPYQLEWDHLVEAIRQDKPHNEAKRGAEASLVTSMGRMAAHTGRIITRDQMLNHEHEFAPDVDKLTADSPAPVQADKDGKYPVPEPGLKKTREY
jgi:predicted dehydrogenase